MSLPLQQKLYHRPLPRAHRLLERRLTPAIPAVLIHTLKQQCLYHFEVAFYRRHCKGTPAVVVDMVDVRAPADEGLHLLYVPDPRRIGQRCESLIRVVLQRFADRLDHGELVGVLFGLLLGAGQPASVRTQSDGRKNVVADDLKLLRIVAEQLLTVGLAEDQQLDVAVRVRAAVEPMQHPEEEWHLAHHGRHVRRVVVDHALDLFARAVEDAAGAPVDEAQLPREVAPLEHLLVGHQEDHAQARQQRAEELRVAALEDLAPRRTALEDGAELAVRDLDLERPGQVDAARLVLDRLAVLKLKVLADPLLELGGQLLPLDEAQQLLHEALVRLHDGVPLRRVADDCAQDHARLPYLDHDHGEGEDEFWDVVRDRGGVRHRHGAEPPVEAEQVLRRGRRGQAVVQRKHRLHCADPGASVHALHTGDPKVDAAHPVGGHEDDEAELEDLEGADAHIKIRLHRCDVAGKAKHSGQKAENSARPPYPDRPSCNTRLSQVHINHLVLDSACS